MEIEGVELTPAEKAERSERLAQAEHLGALARDFCKHPFFKTLEKLLDNEVAKLNKRIADSKDKEECWSLKCEVAPYQRVKELIFKTIAKGDVANISRRLEQDSAKAE